MHDTLAAAAVILRIRYKRHAGRLLTTRTVMDGCQVLKLLSLQVREGQAQIFGVCPQSEISQFAAKKLSQPLARVNGYGKSKG